MRSPVARGPRQGEIRLPARTAESEGTESRGNKGRHCFRGYLRHANMMDSTCATVDSPPREELAYARWVLGLALGDTNGLIPAMEMAGRLLPHLLAGHDEDGDRKYRGVRSAPDLHDQLHAIESLADGLAQPRLTLTRWPGDAPFALFLSHDIDQIYDREFFRVLADANHVRRLLVSGETGSLPLASRRILRALFRPKPTSLDFETLLSLEAKHGFRSTFFVLHDRYLARQGARFAIEDREMREIGRLIVSANAELGVHGGYYRFNNAALYRESRERLAAVFGIQPVGIRNHLLRYSYPQTWVAQEAAGFEYDATYGFRSVPGPRSGLALPFFTYDAHQQRMLDLIELPLTVMDTSIFRYLRLAGTEALEFAWRLIERLAGHGALVTLLWHNNFFNEPEYWDWHMVYERLLERLAALKPWCAPGVEINRWWRARAAARVVMTPDADPNARTWQLQTPSAIRELTLRISPGAAINRVEVREAEAVIQQDGAHWSVRFAALAPGQTARITAHQSR